MSRAAPWFVSAPEPMTTSPARTWSWIEPDVPMRMIVVMPTCTSSLTTMLIDGAPMPLVAHTTGGAAGQRGDERVEAAVAGQRAAAAEVRRGDQLGAPGIPAEQGDRRAGRQVAPARTRCGTCCVVRRHGSGL